MFFLVPAFVAAQTPTQIDWNTQIKNRPTDFAYVDMIQTWTALQTFNGGIAGTSALFTAGISASGAQIAQNLVIPNGGYTNFTPLTYDPYNGAICHDVWGNVVTQPLPSTGLPAFGPNDIVLWNSTSPSMPFQAGTGSGLVQNVFFTSPASTNTGSCGIPLPVNLDYGLNTNGYFFARGGHATDLPVYNAIQALQGGMVANSYTAGVLYPAGTLVCTSSTSGVCTATTTLVAPAYLGGHVDIGHSCGPPFTGGTTILLGTNPFSGGEGLVQGMEYWDDCLGYAQIYNGSAWTQLNGGGGGGGGAIGPTNAVQFASASTGLFNASANFEYSFSTGNLNVCITLGGACSATSGVNAQAFSSTASGTAVGYTNGAGSFTILGNGTGNFQFLGLGDQSGAATGSAGEALLSATSTALYVSLNGGSPINLSGGGGSCPSGSAGQVQYTNGSACQGSANMTYNNSTGVLTIGGSGSTPGMVAPVFNCTATGGADCMQQSSGTFTITGAGAALFQTLGVGSGDPFNVTSAGNMATSGQVTLSQASGTTLTISTTGDAVFAPSGAGVFGAGIAVGSYGLASSGALTVLTANSMGASGLNSEVISATNNSTVQTLGVSNNNASGIAFDATVPNSTGSVAIFQNSTGTCQIEPTTTALVCSSDSRLKTGDQTITTGLEILEKLRPVTYAWKKDGAHDRHPGFFAQEVQAIIPELVGTDRNKYLTMNYTGLVPYLVSAVQELQAEIVELRKSMPDGKNHFSAASSGSVNITYGDKH